MLNRLHNILLFTLLFEFTTILSTAQTPTLEIWQIQGAAATSAYQGQEIRTTENVITAVGSGFFFLQSPLAQADQDAATSNGIYVASHQAGNRRVGDLVRVKGTVLELDGRTQLGQGNVEITVLGTGEPLPEAVPLSENFPAGVAQTPLELEALEGMRICFSGISSGPADYRSMLPVVARTQRPFREAGITYPGVPGLPVWDGNPEIFWILPNALGGVNDRFVSAKTPVAACGPLFQAGPEYILFSEQLNLGTGPVPRPVRAAQGREIRVAGLNTRRLEEANEYYDQKVKKLARYIVEMLQGPDLIALQEVGSSTALSTLRFFIQQLQPDLAYSTFFLAGNDDIHVAYLAREDVFQDVEVSQLGKQEKLPGGAILFDRPPLLFSAAPALQPATRINVLNVHLRALLGIEGDSQEFVREKRHGQALAVARMVQELQDSNLLVVGDFNAFPFSDGYVDVINQISGQAGLGALYPLEMIVHPPLQKLGDALPLHEQYSYVFDGSAQMLDHALAGKLNGLEVVEMSFARANADFPDAYAPNELLVERSSDHDGFVIFLQPDQPSPIADRLLENDIRVYPNPVRSGREWSIDIPAGLKGNLHLVSAEGKTLWSSAWPLADARNSVYPGAPPGIYFLLFQTARNFFYRKKIIVLPGN